MKTLYYSSLTLPLIILIFSVIGILKNRKLKHQADGMLTPPPSFPETTPTIVINGIVVGEATYSGVYDPESLVNVLSVSSNVVNFQDNFGNSFSLPIDEFLVSYTPRKTTSIARK